MAAAKSSSPDNPETVTDRDLFRSSGNREDRREDNDKTEEGFIDAIEKIKKSLEKFVKVVEEALGGGFSVELQGLIDVVWEKIDEAEAFGKPCAHVSGILIPYISLDRADLVINVLIKNPNPVPIQLVEIHYLINSDGQKLVSGSGLAPDAGTIRAHGEDTVKIQIAIHFDEIRGTYGDIRPGSIIPYLIHVVLLVDTAVLGRIEIPLEKSGHIHVPNNPDVDVDKIKVQPISFEETTATIHLSLDKVGGTTKLKKDDEDDDEE